MVVDTKYYDVLQIPPTADELSIKKVSAPCPFPCDVDLEQAYRRQAILVAVLYIFRALTPASTILIKILILRVPPKQKL